MGSNFLKKSSTVQKISVKSNMVVRVFGLCSNFLNGSNHLFFQAVFLSVIRVLIKYNNENIEVHEVKPNKLYLKPDDIECYQQVEHILDHFNINFKIIDRFDLFITNEYELLTTLYFYHRNKTLSWPNFQIQEALEVISRLNVQVLNEIYEGLEKNNLPRELGDYLIFYRYIPIPSFFGSRRSIKNRRLL